MTKSRSNRFAENSVLPDGVSIDLANAKIEISGIDPQSVDSVTVKSDARGHFATEIIAGRVSIMATSKDESYFGNTIVDVRDGLIEVPMYPMLVYEGARGIQGKMTVTACGVQGRDERMAGIDNERADPQETPKTPVSRTQSTSISDM